MNAVRTGCKNGKQNRVEKDEKNTGYRMSNKDRKHAARLDELLRIN